MKKRILTVVAMMLVGQLAIAGTADQMQAEFEQQSDSANSAAGKTLWQKRFTDAKSSQQRSCTSCHGNDLSKPGKHVKTDKVIEPMAPSVNRQRLTERKKITKWFKRNCKWTLGRECTVQEKADLLAFLKTR